MSGLVNGDSAASVLSGALVTTATIHSAPGSYVITQGSLAVNDNYTLTFVPGTLTVMAATYKILLPLAVKRWSRAFD